MSESVNLPALGESVTEGTVTRWLKNVGDNVEVDEPLVEISTDKVDTEIPSPISGVLEEILVQEDETVEVGSPLARIGSGVAVAESAAPTQSPEVAAVPPTPLTEASAPAEQPKVATQEVPQPEVPEPVVTQSAISEPIVTEPVVAEPVTVASIPLPVTPVDAPAPLAAAQPPAFVAPSIPSAPAVSNGALSDDTDRRTLGAGYVTPIVRKLANEHGVDLQTLVGTGTGGRIRKEDVLAASKSGGAARVVTPASVSTSPLRGTTAEMSRLRQVTAQRATSSLAVTAQLTSVVEVDVTEIAALIDQLQDAFNAKTGVALGFAPFFAFAATEALRVYPIINATLSGSDIVYPDTENVAVSVDTERGLLTPVIHGAGELTVADFAKATSALEQQTKSNTLTPAALSGATFTIIDTGALGALFDTPIVYLPQVATLSTGAVSKHPVVVDSESGDAIAVRSTVYLALSYDNRAIDGSDAARFLNYMKDRLEQAEFDEALGLDL